MLLNMARASSFSLLIRRSRSDFTSNRLKLTWIHGRLATRVAAAASSSTQTLTMKRASKIKKSSSSDDSTAKTSSPLSSVSLMTVVKVSVLIVAIFLIATYWKKTQTGIKDLTKADADTLKQAFFGDVPHLFYCSKGTKDEKIPTVFTEAHTYKGNTMGFAKVNCSQVLPSGKNLWQRFKIKKEIRPTLFATAPWMKPQQVAANHLKDYVALAKYIDTAMAPKPTVVTADKDLQKFCGFDKNTTTDVRSITDTCVVVLRGTRHTKVHSDLEKRLVLEYPRVRFAAVDATKKRLSLEESGDYLTADHFALKLHALRNGTHFVTMVNPATWDYLSTFVSQAIGTPLYGLSGDGNVPIRLVKARSEKPAKSAEVKPKKTPKKPASPPAEPAPERAAPTADAAPLTEAELEAAEAERVRKERLRREAMERAAKEHHIGSEEDADEEVDEEAEEEGGEGGDDEDDSVIEL